MDPQNKDFSPATHKSRHIVDVLHNPFAAWVILLASIIITFIAWYISNDYAEQTARERFDFHVDEAQAAIQNRMKTYEQMLRGGIGLFMSSNDVSRDEWRRYVTNLQIDKFWPGVQGVGFSLWISPDQRTKVIKKVRAEGFPDFTIRPDGERTIYTSILYLEPFGGRNLRAFGFDMFSEPTRRAAMQRAIDTGEPAISGRVTLVQETEKDVQAGFLMYLPLYHKTATTIAERRREIRGFVYSPFRIRDLMQGILGGGLRDLAFDIYDGTQVDPAKLLYASKQAKQDALFSKTMTIEMAGNPWTIRYATTPQFDADNDTSQPLIVAVGGLMIDVLLFYIIISLSKLRQRALELAEHMVEKLGDQQLHFKSITDTANDGIIATDGDGVINYFNKAAQNIFGYSSDQVLGKSSSILAPARFRAPHNQGLAKFNAVGVLAGSGKPIELIGLRKSGEEFPMELSLSHWTSHGRHHVNAVVRDISERKKIERMKSEFVSTVSHELRTPLTAIRGAIGLLAHAKEGSSSNNDQLLTLANNNIERLSRLIDDLLDVEKMESSHLSMDIKAYPLVPLITSAVDAQQAAAQKADITLVLEPPAAIDVLADNDRFQQVIANLVSNAIKFSPKKSQIRVSTQLKGAKVEIRITDQGPGIPDEFRDRIFQKFAQADSSDSRAKGGTGLGLSICKMLVEKLGGEIGYVSTKGQGAQFYFTLPVAHPDQAKQAVGY